MSFLTATNTELIYNMNSAGADNATAVATVMSANSTTNPAAYLPPLFSVWQPSTVVGKGFSVRLGGTFDQAAGNAVTFAYGLNTTQASTTLAKTLAATGSAAWTNTTTGVWHAQLDVTVAAVGESVGTPAASVYVDGFLAVGTAGGTAAATVYPLASSANTVPTAVSISPVTAYYWELVFTWGTAPTHSACQKHMIFGLN